MQRHGLSSQVGGRGRCTACNRVLEEVDKEQVVARLEPKTKKYYQEFHLCSNCDKVYWQGSHYQNLIEKLFKEKDKLINKILILWGYRDGEKEVLCS